jgi:L-2-hydroxyglutarate oxidase
VVEHVDVVIVGGGIVGLATAYQLLHARPSLRVTVLEREPEVGRQQSSRNSGVVHAGLYYTPGSAKARFCRDGKAAMERFCREHGVPLERVGKVVVAVRRTELTGLRALAERARTNGVPVEELDSAGLAEREPHASGLAGLWSPTTAVTDFGRVCLALADSVRQAGGAIRTGVQAEGLDERGTTVRVRTSGSDIEADVVIACAGLEADRVAELTGHRGDDRVVPFRGSWLRLRPELSHLVRGNIYPVPQPDLPFLGIHLTRRIDGQVWIGPNAVLAAARGGARPWSLDRRDLTETLRFRGTWRLATRHAKVAVSELWHDRVMRAAVREIQRYVPEIRHGDLERGPWGVRAQLVRPSGDLVDDFEIRGSARVLHVLNAPSPAATASLAIGAELTERVLARLAG